MSLIVLYILATIGGLVVFSILFFALSWLFVRAVTRAVLRRETQRLSALTSMLPNDSP